MSRNHFNRRRTEIKKIAYEALPKCAKDYTRTRITALEREMYRELRIAAKQATKGLDIVDAISRKGTRTDDDANRAIEATQPIKLVYQRNKAFMNMSDNQYYALTGPFTRARNRWQRYIRESPEPYTRTLSEKLRREVINLRREVIQEVIQESRNFLQTAKTDIERRIPIQDILNDLAAHSNPSQNPIGSPDLHGHPQATDDLDSHQKTDSNPSQNPIGSPDLQGRPLVTYNPLDSSMASQPLEGSNIGTKDPNLIKNLDIENLARRVKELSDDISKPGQANEIDTLLNNIIETYKSIDKSIHTPKEIEGLNTLTQEFLLKARNHIDSDEKLKELQDLYTTLPDDISKLGQNQQVSLDVIIQTYKTIIGGSSHMNEEGGEPNSDIQEFQLKVQNHIDSDEKLKELQDLYTTFTTEVERDPGPLQGGDSTQVEQASSSSQRNDQQAAWRAAYDDLKNAIEAINKEDNNTSKKSDYPNRSEELVAFRSREAYKALRLRVLELKAEYDASKSDPKKLKATYDASKSERTEITLVNEYVIQRIEAILKNHKDGTVPEQLLKDLQQILAENECFFQDKRSLTKTSEK